MTSGALRAMPLWAAFVLAPLGMTTAQAQVEITVHAGIDAARLDRPERGPSSSRPVRSACRVPLARRPPSAFAWVVQLPRTGGGMPGWCGREIGAP